MASSASDADDGDEDGMYELHALHKVDNTKEDAEARSSSREPAGAVALVVGKVTGARSPWLRVLAISLVRHLPYFFHGIMKSFPTTIHLSPAPIIDIAFTRSPPPHGRRWCLPCRHGSVFLRSYPSCAPHTTFPPREWPLSSFRRRCKRIYKMGGNHATLIFVSNAFFFLLLFSFPFLPFMFIFSIRRDSWSLGRSAGTCACEIRGCQAISNSVLLVRFLISNSVLLVPDRVPPRILMCVGSIGAALMNLPIMARPPYGVLLLLRFLVGAFVAIGQSRNPSNVTQVELSS